MIYHPEEHKLSKVVKILAFWVSMMAMVWLSVMVFHDDVKIPQKQATLKIDLKNKVNICLPQDNEL
jgi:hypothetical protein